MFTIHVTSITVDQRYLNYKQESYLALPYDDHDAILFLKIKEAEQFCPASSLILDYNILLPIILSISW